MLPAYLLCRNPCSKHGRHVDVKLPVNMSDEVGGKEDVACPDRADRAAHRFGAEVISLACAGPHARAARAPGDNGLVDPKALQEPGEAEAKVIEHEGQLLLVGLDDVGRAQCPLEPSRQVGEDPAVLGPAQIALHVETDELFRFRHQRHGLRFDVVGVKRPRVNVADLGEKGLHLARRDGIGRLGHELLAPVPPGFVDEPGGVTALAGVDGKTLCGKDVEEAPLRLGNVRHDGRLHAQPLEGKPAVGDHPPQPLRCLAVLDDAVDRDGADDDNGRWPYCGNSFLHAVSTDVPCPSILSKAVCCRLSTVSSSGCSKMPRCHGPPKSRGAERTWRTPSVTRMRERR